MRGKIDLRQRRFKPQINGPTGAARRNTAGRGAVRPRGPRVRAERVPLWPAADSGKGAEMNRSVLVVLAIIVIGAAVGLALLQGAEESVPQPVAQAPAADPAPEQVAAPETESEAELEAEAEAEAEAEGEAEAEAESEVAAEAGDEATD